MEIKLNHKLTNLTKAFLSLKKAINTMIEDESIKMDSVIQRFEYTIELFWKTLKVVLLNNGISENLLITPREILVQSYKLHLIDDEKIWIEMLLTRNETSHIYDETKAIMIYQLITATYCGEMEKCLRIIGG